MSNKRSHIDIDPDYQDVTDHQNKRQRVLEKDAKEATVRKIESIIRCQFEAELRQKESEIGLVDQRLNQALLLMDRLRACIVASQYSSTIPGTKDRSQPPSIHPTVKKKLGKAPATVTSGAGKMEESQSRSINLLQTKLENKTVEVKKEPGDSHSAQEIPASSIISPYKMGDTRGSRFKIKKKIIVGNVSKFIPVERREVNDQSTHKWMLYVRGPKDKPNIASFIKKVWFFLHPSYKPNDLVEITQPPYHLTRRGWGEFPVRVQLHFRDQRNKRVDIIHNLKLDKTCTGLQTLGAETIVEVELERDNPRSDSPVPVLAVNQHDRLMTSPCTVENTTVEKQSDVSGEPMEVDKAGGDGAIKCRVERQNSLGEDTDKQIQNGAAYVNEPVTVRSKEAENSRKDVTPKVIHLKTCDIFQGDLCKKPTSTDNHSMTGMTSTSSESPASKQQGVMYMRCKDHQGNLLLLPYKLGPPQQPTKPVTDAGKTINVEIGKESTASNKSHLMPSSSPTSAKNGQPSVKPASTTVPQPGAAKPATTNLVLKVTPTGLKLVPADREAPAAPTAAKSSSSSVPAGDATVRPKLKSLLNTSPLNTNPAGHNIASTPGPAVVTSTAKSVIQKPAIGGMVSKQSVSNLKLVNHSVPNVSSKPQQTSPDAANQSLVLANIGDKQYLLRVISGADNQVLLVPNKPANTPSATQAARSANQTKTVLPQKSLIGSSSTGVCSSQASDQKSMTFSFGLSPFSLKTPSNQSNASHQKTGLNHVAVPSEKKIHVWKKKIKDMLDITEEVKPLNTPDYPDLLSIIRAAVRRHPVVQEVVDRSLHPYCARSTEEWLSWSVGKRRASEWQRAATVKNFIRSHLKDENSFKGEQLWTTRQIMSWCRFHAFSPHHLENINRSEEEAGINSVSIKHSPVTSFKPLSSLSDHQPLQDRLDSLLSEVATSDDSDEDIDVLSVELPKVKLKTELVESIRPTGDCEVLPPSDEAVFVQDVAQQIGLKFHPVDIESGVQGSVTEEVIYAVMCRLAEDLLREAYSVTRQQPNSSENDVKAEHVFKAVSNMSVVDFLTNKNLGIHDNTAPLPGVR